MLEEEPVLEYSEELVSTFLCLRLRLKVVCFDFQMNDEIAGQTTHRARGAILEEPADARGGPSRVVPGVLEQAARPPEKDEVYPRPTPALEDVQRRWPITRVPQEAVPEEALAQELPKEEPSR